MRKWGFNNSQVMADRPSHCQWLGEVYSGGVGCLPYPMEVDSPRHLLREIQRGGGDRCGLELKCGTKLE